MMLPTMQSARPELADFTPPKSLQNGKRVDHKPPVSMSVHAGMHASTGSELKPVDHSSPINNARFCRSEGAPKMMDRPKVTRLAAQIAAGKNADVLRVLTSAKNPLTPTEIALAIERSGGTWAVKPKDGFAQGVADTALVCAVLRRIKAVKVERGLWLKPGANVKS